MTLRVRITLVPGEEELGPQQWCSHCREWYPADAEFYYRDRYRRTGLMSFCKACWEEIRRSSEAQLEAYRAANRTYRERRRYAVSQASRNA